MLWEYLMPSLGAVAISAMVASWINTNRVANRLLDAMTQVPKTLAEIRKDAKISGDLGTCYAAIKILEDEGWVSRSQIGNKRFAWARVRCGQRRKSWGWLRQSSRQMA